MMARAGDDGPLPSLTGAKWLMEPATRAVLAALLAEDTEARAVGGAVRNALMGGKGRSDLYIYKVDDPVSEVWAKLRLANGKNFPRRIDRDDAEGDARRLGLI